MIRRIQAGGLQVDSRLWNFVNDELAPDTGISASTFWEKLEAIVNNMAPRNRQLLEKREQLQHQIDHWHRDNPDFEPSHYETFLRDIGYLVEEGEDFSVTTTNVDTEITHQPGPQLVVPVKNARFALNAANARWGSLYDALYGTDAISEDGGAERTQRYNPIRGAKVVEFAKAQLDIAAPLVNASHKQACRYYVEEQQLVVELLGGECTTLVSPDKFVGFQGDENKPDCILLRNHGLHIEIQLDDSHFIGKSDSANIKDMLVEAAVTTIMDCEDSVAVVDAEDKVEVYRNWLGLMKGNLTANINKGGKNIERRLNAPRCYKTPQRRALTLAGRSLLFVRNVGHLMTIDAVLDKQGEPIPEGILDGMFTTFAALHDLQATDMTKRNSRAGSVNIVKPKMHGPEEVRFTCDLFTQIEDALKLARNTIKLGIMDEERRTTVNLKECIRVAKERVVFINTGFLDRTGDEIHTSMHAGPFVPKTAMKQQPWINAYEDWNVDIGLACGLKGRAQIGKGMWAMPDEMADLLEQKINHPLSGANTAWVPSPNGAVLHALHYHQVDVLAQQDKLKTRVRASLTDLLTIPLLANKAELTAEQIQFELDNNAQSILGYVVRWIDQGIGCSKVPDINHIGLMEDRATLRISSQHLANWLHHGVCTKEQVLESMQRMAVVVDHQNTNDDNYINMAPSFEGIAFKAACDLVFEGKTQPSGYTEPLLHAYRIKAKQTTAA